MSILCFIEQIILEGIDNNMFSYSIGSDAVTTYNVGIWLSVKDYYGSH